MTKLKKACAGRVGEMCCLPFPSTMTNFTPYYYAAWEPGGVYHVYNRATYRDRLFRNRVDHFKFCELVFTRMSRVLEVFSYALVLNHFHSGVRLPLEEALLAHLNQRKALSKPEAAYLEGTRSYNSLFGFYWANALKSFAQSVNKRIADRSGTLYESSLRHIRVRDDLISRRLIMYHHTNEMHHGLSNSFREQHERNSWSAYCDPALARFLTTGPVLERFGGLDAMVVRHEAYIKRFGPDLKAFDERKYFGYGMPARGPAPYVEWLEDEVADYSNE